MLMNRDRTLSDPFGSYYNQLSGCLKLPSGVRSSPSESWGLSVRVAWRRASDVRLTSHRLELCGAGRYWFEGAASRLAFAYFSSNLTCIEATTGARPGVRYVRKIARGFS